MLRIKELRLENSLTQKELAEKISAPSKSVWAYENNVAVPPLDVLIKLANAFGCSIDYLAGRSDDFGNVTVRTAGAQLTKDEERLLSVYRKLTEKNKMHVSAYAQVRLEEQDGGEPQQSSLRWK